MGSGICSLSDSSIHPENTSGLIDKEEYMPLVRIDLRKGKSSEYHTTVGQVVYQAMVDTLGVPKDDRFQVITEHSGDDLIFDPSYPGDIQRSNDCVFIQVTLNGGRTVERKQQFYKAVAEALHESLRIRMDDIFINLVEVVKENWSFGHGIAQYAPPK
jgi:4-oxalocrotonate tautomerase